MIDNRLAYKLLFKSPPQWRGVPVLKFPNDFTLYTEVIQERQPDFIVETGTYFGGSACFFADTLELTGKGRVITIDVKKQRRPHHPNVTYLHGSSTDPKIVDMVKEIVGNKLVMASLDSSHRFHHVKKELQLYSQIVTEGQYLVVEDLCDRRGRIRKSRGPAPAVEWFLQTNRNYRRVLLGPAVVTKYGWLRNG